MDLNIARVSVNKRDFISKILLFPFLSLTTYPPDPPAMIDSLT